MTDKLSGRRYERLHVLEDEPDMGDLYNFCPVDGARVWRPEDAETRVLADGPVVWELELRVEAERPAGLEGDQTATVPLTIVTIARLVRGAGRVEFRTTVENNSRDHRLRVAFAAGTGRRDRSRRIAVRARAPSARATRHRGPSGPSRRTRPSTRSARSRSGPLRS